RRSLPSFPTRRSSDLIVLGVLAFCAAIPASGQTKGRVSVGGAVTLAQPTDKDVKSVVTFGPLVRLNPRKGWGLAGGLSWFELDLDRKSTRLNSSHDQI